MTPLVEFQQFNDQFPSKKRVLFLTLVRFKVKLPLDVTGQEKTELMTLLEAFNLLLVIYCKLNNMVIFSMLFSVL